MTSISFSLSSYEHIILHLKVHLPVPLQTIVLGYCEKETWPKIDSSKAEYVANLGKKLLSFGKAGRRQKENLAQALLTGNISKAIEAIKSGASPQINGDFFCKLLQNNQWRALNFILIQMKAHNKEMENLIEKIGQLKPELMIKGLEIYFKHGAKLCAHQQIKLEKAAKDNKDKQILELLRSQIMNFKCSCDDDAQLKVTTRFKSAPIIFYKYEGSCCIIHH